jgi:hypothetical protein
MKEVVFLKGYTNAQRKNWWEQYKARANASKIHILKNSSLQRMFYNNVVKIITYKNLAAKCQIF